MTLQTGAAAAELPSDKQPTFLGHPVGLYILFLTEMWERFNYYGMRALLMLYMVNALRWHQEDASTIYKWYSSLVYLTPLAGGYLADRVLGNKWAVVIGAIIMALGEFLLAFSPVQIFYSGLIFMIVGNGFFKPNMSTQVGRLYPQGDPRRDGAYTIFYMGINLGAFLAPLVCGGLASYFEGPGGANYHLGFIAAGVGMVLGLLTYVIGLPWVHELPQGQAEAPQEQAPGTMRPPRADEEGVPPVAETLRGSGEASQEQRPALSEEEAGRTPSVAPWLTQPLPVLLVILAVLLAGGGVTLWLLHRMSWDNMLSMEIAAGAAVFAAWISAQVQWALRDRLLSIFIMGIPVVAFWAAGEQAGNTLNIWADKMTNRYITTQPPTPSVYPGPEKRLDVVDPVPTTWFQSINPLAIFVLAPPFAALWTWLAVRGWNPSIPTKMAFGVLFASASMGLMTWAAAYENGPTLVPFAGPLPESVPLDEQNHLLLRKDDGQLVPFHAGRLTYDAKDQSFHMFGVLSNLERDDIVGQTAPPGYVEALTDLQKQGKEGNRNATEKLAEVPPGFNLDYAGLSQVTFDPKQDVLEVHDDVLADKDIKALRVAGGNEAFRKAMDTLYLESSRYRVSSWWLFWSYVLATVGELCLSPIGLSMVSKLAPARFATMLMGLWMLTSFFGNFIAGALGEQAASTPPVTFFLEITLVLGVLSLVVFVVARWVGQLMHGVD